MSSVSTGAAGVCSGLGSGAVSLIGSGVAIGSGADVLGAGSVGCSALG